MLRGTRSFDNAVNCRRPAMYHANSVGRLIVTPTCATACPVSVDPAAASADVRSDSGQERTGTRVLPLYGHAAEAVRKKVGLTGRPPSESLSPGLRQFAALSNRLMAA